MKLLGALLFLFPFFAQANVGFTCPSLKTEIALRTQDKTASLVVIQNESRTERTNPRLDLPFDGSFEAYQRRVQVYHTLMSEAQVRFPYMPELFLVFNVINSTPKYKKGFKAFEGEGEPVKLSKMYCKAFIKALVDY